MMVCYCEAVISCSISKDSKKHTDLGIIVYDRKDIESGTET